MKRTPWIRGFFCLLALMLCCVPFGAQADDAGVLTEGELNEWIMQVLQRSKEEQPQNAPISEDSLTEDGYAFLYSFATLYYDKPVLDGQSVLHGFTIMEEAFDTPRGIRLGAPAEMLMSAYGWQNPYLLGDGSFAALYVLNQLPKAAYWSWAQHEADQITAVQCAIHARAAESRYTDAGIIYQVENGAISSIRVYGLNQTVTLADVESNLAAVAAVQAAGSGDETEDTPPVAQGNYFRSESTVFGFNDLQFSHIDFCTLTEAGANAAFGEPEQEDWVQDNTGEWLHTTQRDGVTLTHALDQNKQNSRLEMLSITRTGLEGPRGMQIGDALDSVIALFRSDGTGLTNESEALLYGDGVSAPYGALETAGNSATLRYLMSLPAEDGTTREITLHLSFLGNRLTEIMVYSW